MEKAIELTDLRKRIDLLNEKIIAGLKTRSKYALNEGVFIQNFSEGKSWFFYRLKKEQDLDSEFGRFLYYDQQPFAFRKEELSKAKIGEVANNGLAPIQVDLSEKIILFYRKLLSEICEKKEDKSTYGETTKLDVENVLTLNERTVGVGEQVAAYKVTTDPLISNLNTPQEIKQSLIKPEREKEVIEQMLSTAKRYGIEKDELITQMAKELITITLDAEVQFIMHYKK